ncbi:MAG: hypothetical protein ABW250_15910 [Pyrinomonadaceae bacterium]
MSKLPDIASRMKEVMSFADFTPGQRYADGALVKLFRRNKE